MAYVSVVPLIIHCAASAPGSSGRKRPMTLMRSLASKKPPPRTSAASLMLVQERARRDGQRKRQTPKLKLVQNGASLVTPSKISYCSKESYW